MCGCGKKSAIQRAKAAADAEARLAEMEAEQARELVPLGLNPAIHLPTKIAHAVNGKDVIIAPEGDNRVYGNAQGGRQPIVIRGGHNGKLPAKMREQIVARVPGAFKIPQPPEEEEVERHEPTQSPEHANQPA